MTHDALYWCIHIRFPLSTDTIQKTYHFGCIVTRNKFVINVPSICYIRWIGIGSTQELNIYTFRDTATGQCTLSNHRNRYFRSIFYLNSQKLNTIHIIVHVFGSKFKLFWNIFYFWQKLNKESSKFSDDYQEVCANGTNLCHFVSTTTWNEYKIWNIEIGYFQWF